MSLTVEKCLQAWTNSLRQMNAKADIVFFGDSLTYYGDFSSAFPDKVVCNLGLRGDTIQGMIKRVEQIESLEPKVVYLMAGINDISDKSTNSFGRIYEKLILKLQLLCPKAEIVIQSLLPVNDLEYSISCSNGQIIEVNKKLFRLSQKHGLSFIDLYNVYCENDRLPCTLTVDGIHLLNSSYVHWYKTLNNTLLNH